MAVLKHEDRSAECYAANAVQRWLDCDRRGEFTGTDGQVGTLYFVSWC
jgi:hypothetical protein